MVAGVKEPDVLGAVMGKIRADAEVGALIGSGASARISTAFPEGDRAWVMPDYAILVRKAGGPQPFMSLGKHYTRVDVRCYGKGDTLNIRRMNADLLWQWLNPVLCPPPGTVPSGWRTATMIVDASDQESEVIPMIEPGTDWPLVLCSYMVRWRRRA